MMNIARKDIELMAPAGSYEAMMAAIQGGADAVYFGVEKLNMRSRSSFNFTLNDLRKLADIAGEKEVKTYLALNTILYDSDLLIMRETMEAAKASGISAVIASDQAVLEYGRQIGIEVHLSTQLNISNIESVRFYSGFADVVVLARELSLDQIRLINRAIDEHEIKGPSGKLIRTELFVHGAMCMAISGKCYLSLHQYNHSANRGECIQVCRRGYLVTESETGKELLIDNQYIMSPKDLCTISFLDQILDAGIRVLKIEGRARSPEYVKTTARCYHEGLVACAEGSFSEQKVAKWTEELAKVFNRGFWDGHYLGRELGEWSNVYGSKASRKKTYIGKVKNYFSRQGIAEIVAETGRLHAGDEILFTGPTTGVIEMVVEEMRIDDQQRDEISKGDIFSLPVTEQVRRSDKLYKYIPADSMEKP